MKKKLLTILATTLLSISLLAGCRKEVSRQDTTVKVKVVNSYHKDRIPQIKIDSDGNPKITYIAEKNYVYVEYEGAEYTFSGEYYYQRYGQRIGSEIAATLRTIKYDDGTTYVNLIGLK